MKQSYEKVIETMEEHNFSFQQTLNFHRSPTIFLEKEEKKDIIKMRLHTVGNMDNQSAINTLKDCVKELLDLI